MGDAVRRESVSRAIHVGRRDRRFRGAVSAHGGIQETQEARAITYSVEDPEDAPWWWIARVMFKSLYFSVVTFATLGYGDIQPIGTVARFLAGIEALLGALLAALLVFVLTRIVTW